MTTTKKRAKERQRKDNENYKENLKGNNNAIITAKMENNEFDRSLLLSVEIYIS